MVGATQSGQRAGAPLRGGPEEEAAGLCRKERSRGVREGGGGFGKGEGGPEEERVGTTQSGPAKQTPPGTEGEKSGTRGTPSEGGNTEQLGGKGAEGV